MNDQFFEMDETDNEEELLAFDHEDEGGDYEGEFDAGEYGGSRDDREIELAAELLSVSDEQELDQFPMPSQRTMEGHVIETPPQGRQEGQAFGLNRRCLPSVT